MTLQPHCNRKHSRVCRRTTSSYASILKATVRLKQTHKRSEVNSKPHITPSHTSQDTTQHNTAQHTTRHRQTKYMQRCNTKVWFRSFCLLLPSVETRQLRVLSHPLYAAVHHPHENLHQHPPSGERAPGFWIGLRSALGRLGSRADLPDLLTRAHRVLVALEHPLLEGMQRTCEGATPCGLQHTPTHTTPHSHCHHHPCRQQQQRSMEGVCACGCRPSHRRGDTLSPCATGDCACLMHSHVVATT